MQELLITVTRLFGSQGVSFSQFIFWALVLTYCGLPIEDVESVAQNVLEIVKG